MAKLIALVTKQYAGIGTVNPGDTFDIPDRYARALTALKLARVATADDDPNMMPVYRQRAMRIERIEPPMAQSEEAPEETAPVEAQAHVMTTATMAAEPHPEPAQQQQDEEEDQEAVRREHVVQALRTRAAAEGVEVDGRWGEERLRREIATARANRYERRDMQARQ